MPNKIFTVEGYAAEHPEIGPKEWNQIAPELIKREAEERAAAVKNHATWLSQRAEREKAIGNAVNEGKYVINSEGKRVRVNVNRQLNAFKSRVAPKLLNLAKPLLYTAGAAAAIGAGSKILPGIAHVAGFGAKKAGTPVLKKVAKYGAVAAVPVTGISLYQMHKNNVNDDKYYLYNQNKVKEFDNKNAALKYRQYHPEDNYTMNKGATLKSKLND